MLKSIFFSKVTFSYHKSYSFLALWQNCKMRLFFMSVCRFIRMKELGSHWTEFYEILYLSIFTKSVEKIQISLKCGKNNGYFTWRTIDIYSYLAQFFLEWETFQTKVVENVKTQIPFSIIILKIVPLWDKVEKFCTSGQATNDNT